MLYGIITHGGAGSPEEWRDGCIRAAREGFRILAEGGSALRAVIEAVRLLEDDGRFNAGTGSILRIDGKTIEMDASLMDSTGSLAMVMAVRDVKNPVLLAEALLKTPHLAIAGEGATGFAKRLGLEPHPGPSEKALRDYENLKKQIAQGKIKEINPLWKGYERFLADTVGAVAMDKQGVFAVASSTGGASPMLIGRVGDTPIPGCGFFAGPSGAIAMTGTGEEIIRRFAARTIYELIEKGMAAQEALQRIINSFPEDIPAGAIAITGDGLAQYSNRAMAWASMVEKGS